MSARHPPPGSRIGVIFPWWGRFQANSNTYPNYHPWRRSRQEEWCLKGALILKTDEPPPLLAGLYTRPKAPPVMAGFVRAQFQRTFQALPQEVPLFGENTESYRSLLYVEQGRENGKQRLFSFTGPEGIEHYLSKEMAGRLIQSLKSFLTSRTLHSTEIFGRRVSIEDLIARILRDLRTKAEVEIGKPITNAIAGRPVQFVGAETEEDNRYAEDRLRTAYQLAGFDDVEFELEPVAAAHYYESTLDRDELILIGDFGGGTSDFSLLRVGPTVRRRGRTRDDLLGNTGVGIAGDAFDAKIVKHLVSPYLGAGTMMRSMHKILPVPIVVGSR